MALRIELRDRAGVVLDVAEESWDSISSQWPEISMVEFPILGAIDPDARTMFNRLQMEFCLPELQRLALSAKGKRAELIGRLIAMSQRGAKGIDLELWFLGD